MRDHILAGAALLSASAASAGGLTGLWVEARGDWDKVQFNASADCANISDSNNGIAHDGSGEFDVHVDAQESYGNTYVKL